MAKACDFKHAVLIFCSERLDSLPEFKHTRVKFSVGIHESVNAKLAKMRELAGIAAVGIMGV